MAPIVTKNYLFNLVIYTKDPERKLFFESIIGDFIKRFPCRLIFIQLHALQAFDLSCKGLEQCPQSLCDRITIDASHTAFEKVPFVVLPYLIPDLPVYLFYGLDPTTDCETLPSLEKFAERLIFDTYAIENLPLFCRRLLAELPLRNATYVDLDWVSIRNWRRILAQVFNSAEKIEQLRQMQHIEIGYVKEREECSPISHRLLYLQAWISAQMGWSLKSQEDASFFYATPSGECTIQLHPQQTLEQPAGTILYIAMEGPSQSSCQLIRSNHKISVRLSSPRQCEMPFALSLHDKERSLAFMKEIFYHPVSSHYHKTIEMLAYGHTNIHSSS